MKHTNSILGALLITCLAAPVYAASTESWGSSDVLHSVQTKLDAKQYQSAIDELKTIVAKDTKDADAYNLLGYANRKLKRYDVAETYYQQALQIDPEHAGAMEYLGELYVETDRMGKAEEMLKRLDQSCFLSCSEYRQLKTMIERKQQGLQTSSNW